jgi:hypothetical protein
LVISATSSCVSSTAAFFALTAAKIVASLLSLISPSSTTVKSAVNGFVVSTE